MIIENITEQDIMSNDDLYREVQEYFRLKIIDCRPFSKQEFALLTLFPELDTDSAVSVLVTDEMIDKAAETPNALTEEEIHALQVYLLNSLIDGKKMSHHMVLAYNFVNDAKLDEHNENIDDSLSSTELYSLIFGYNILDKGEVLFHLEKTKKLSDREKELIFKKHGITVEE